MNRKFKELAVIVAGLDEEYQSSVINGAILCARERNANLSCFASFSGVISSSSYDKGEYKIYDLINYARFDGVILLTNTIRDAEKKAEIIEKVAASGLPVSVLDCDDYPSFYNVRIDNKKAMSELVRHVIEVHGAKTINFISGPLTNPEAEDRYMAFLEEMAAHKLPVDVRRVFFGEFRSIDGKIAVQAFKRDRLKKPDAIICANDAMALSAIEELEALGYKVPEDMIVTGFDSTYNARHHLPTITTVERPLEEAGYIACESILDRIEGVERKREADALRATPVFAGSCGCGCELRGSPEEYIKSTYRLINNWRNDVSLLNRMTTALADAGNVDAELDCMEKFIREINCDRFCVCLCEGWDKAFAADRAPDSDRSEDEQAFETYTEKMTAPLIITGEKTRSVDCFSVSDMFPIKRTSGGNISYFLPLHFREACLGYYIITNSDFPLKSMLCHSIMLNLSNSVENIRKLVNLNGVISELDKLYVNDHLCHIYNRNGFMRAADAVYRKCREENRKVLVSFIDMDGLKMINDEYGHKEGDFALQHLARVISDCCVGDRICARFGGDEFIIIGSSNRSDDIEVLEKNFAKQLAAMNLNIEKPYSIDASIGTIVAEIEPNTTVFNIITQADAIMYEKKKRKKSSRYLRKS